MNVLAFHWSITSSMTNSFDIKFGTKRNIYFDPARGVHASDFRCDNEFVFLLTPEAGKFKISRWHEVAGAAYGSAEVTGHPEWEALYAWLLGNCLPKWYEGRDVSRNGPDYLITVMLEAPELPDNPLGIVHVGSIYRCNGRLCVGG